MKMPPQNRSAFLVAVSAVVATSVVVNWPARKLNPPPPPQSETAAIETLPSVDAAPTLQPPSLLEPQGMRAAVFDPPGWDAARTASAKRAAGPALSPRLATPIARRVSDPREEARRSARDALDRARAWLASTQAEDGSWSFPLAAADAEKGGRKPPLGRSGATASAVRCFVPWRGDWDGAKPDVAHAKPDVAHAKGVEFLRRSQLEGPLGKGDLRGAGGDLLDHALATAALAEAYAFRNDKSLAGPVQEGVDFLQRNQDAGGGWRRRPDEAADLGTTAAALEALREAHLAYLKVESKSIARAILYLDGLQSEQGAAYGFAEPGDDPTASALGLLCRIHLGWKADDGRIAIGARRMTKRGWSEHDPLWNFAATAYLRHAADLAPWRTWEARALASLLSSQTPGTLPEAPGAGSWAPLVDPAYSAGGRLLPTCLSCRTLLEILTPPPMRHSTTDDF